MIAISKRTHEIYAAKKRIQLKKNTAIGSNNKQQQNHHLNADSLIIFYRPKLLHAMQTYDQAKQRSLNMYGQCFLWHQWSIV